MSRRKIPYHLRDVDNPPAHLEDEQKKNWIKTAVKAKNNFELGEQYPPLNLPRSSYEIIHLHRRTTDDDIRRVFKHIDSCYEFVLDSESDKTTKALSLIQIQTLPTHLPIVILLIAMQHLPAAHTSLHQQMKKIFDMIFNKNNMLYSWGCLSTELKPAQRYKLFVWPIKSTIINLQDEFSEWYRWARSHCEVCCLKFKGNSGGEYENQLDCRCHPKDPYRINEKWAIQKALAYGAELFVDKSSTISHWSNLLDPKYTRLSTLECEKLISYAINDCFAVTCLIRPVLNKWSFQQVTITRIIDFFQALTSTELKLLIQSREEQQVIVKDEFYNDIMFISDEESNEEILVSSINNHLAVEKPVQDDTVSIHAPLNDLNDEPEFNVKLSTMEEDKLLSYDDNHDDTSLQVNIIDDMELPVDNHELVVNDEHVHNEHIQDENDDEQLMNENQNQITSVNKSSNQRRTREARTKRNKKRNNVHRMRRFRYHINRRLYYKFNLPLARKILKLYDIKFIHVKVVKDMLIIGVKEHLIQQYQQQLPDDVFNKKAYYEVFRRQHRHKQHQQQ